MLLGLLKILLLKSLLGKGKVLRSIPASISLFLMIAGTYSAFGEPVEVLRTGTILFSDGRSGSITYNEVANTSTMFLSDGEGATTTYNKITRSAHTVYTDGRTASSFFNDVTQTSHTSFSDGLTANSNFNDVTNTLHTTFSDGTTATTSYNEVTNTATTQVFGIFLLPSMAKIYFSPQSPRIKELLRIKDLEPEEREAGGWKRNEIQKPSSTPSKKED